MRDIVIMLKINFYFVHFKTTWLQFGVYMHIYGYICVYTYTFSISNRHTVLKWTIKIHKREIKRMHKQPHLALLLLDKGETTTNWHT